MAAGRPVCALFLLGMGPVLAQTDAGVPSSSAPSPSTLGPVAAPVAVSDQQRMGMALHLIARLYSIEDRAKGLTGEERLELRQRLSAPVTAKPHKYLLEIRDEVLPKSPEAKALRYALNQWAALSRCLEDGDLEIDSGATERANCGIALGRGNWTFFGSDNGGKTAAVLLSFIAMRKRNVVEPFAWFRDVLSRIATHPVHRLAELLPHNWKLLAAAHA